MAKKQSIIVALNCATIYDVNRISVCVGTLFSIRVVGASKNQDFFSSHDNVLEITENGMQADILACQEGESTIEFGKLKLEVHVIEKPATKMGFIADGPINL